MDLRRLPIILVVALVAGCAAPAPAPASAPGHPAAPPAATTGGLAPDATVPTQGAAADAMDADVAALLAAARASAAGGAPVHVQGNYRADNRTTHEVSGPKLVPGTFDLDLEPGSTIDASTWARIDETQVPMPFVETYRGHVKGIPGDLAELTFATAWARGTVYSGDHSYSISVGDFPLAEFKPGGAATGSHRAAGQPATWPTLSAGPASCTVVPGYGSVRDPTTIKPEVRQPGRSAATPLTARIVLDATAAAGDLLGASTLPYLVYAAQELDLTYDHEVGVRFHLVGVHMQSKALTGGDPGLPGTGQDVFGAMKAYWDGQDLDRDLLVQFDGPAGRLGGSGGEGGQAYCIGAVGEPTQAYAAVDLDAATFNAEGIRYILDHEVGHLFNAEHTDSNPVETDACTLMALTVGVFGLNFVFGTVERSFIRGWAEAHLKPAAMS